VIHFPLMKRSEDPLGLLERSGIRRAVAISFLVGMFFGFLTIFPVVSQYYDEHSALKNFIGSVVVALGLLLAFLELKHSGEANDHRAEQNRLTDEANEFRLKANEYHAEANRLRDVNNELQGKSLELQQRIHELQEGIEKKLTKVRLHVRAQMGGNKLKLLVSNLSDFDLLLKQVELIVTDAANAKPASRTIGGGTPLSRGDTKSEFILYGSLITINGNRADRMNMKFYVNVVAKGVEDNPVTIKSDEYQFTLEPGKPAELKVLKYTT